MGQDRAEASLLVLISVPQVSLNIFSHHVEFKVHGSILCNIADVGVVVRVGNDGHGKFGFGNAEGRKADAVYADGAFFNNEVGKLRGKGKTVFPAPLAAGNRYAGGRGVHMSLHDVAVEAAIELHAPLEVDAVARLPGAEVGFAERFQDGGNAVHAAPHLFNREAGAVVRQTLVGFKGCRER